VLFASASALLVILSAITVDGAAVYDISGDELQYRKSYYITSAIRGAGGGGLYPALPFVAQHSSDINRGSPLSFESFNASDTIVPLLTDLTIIFRQSGVHPGKPVVWNLAHADGNGDRFVTLLPILPIKVNDRFKIEKAFDFVYKLLYCPSVPGAACGNLGIHFEGGKRLLVLKNEPFLVVFVKADLGDISLALPRSTST